MAQARPAGPLGGAPEGLDQQSTTQERLQALGRMGLTIADLRDALGVSDSTVRNWAESATVPRHAALRTLDDLRFAVVGLHHAGLRGDRAAQWLTSRDYGVWLKGARPIDIIRTDPIAVFGAVQDLLDPPGAPAQVITLHPGAGGSRKAPHVGKAGRKTGRRRARAGHP